MNIKEHYKPKTNRLPPLGLYVMANLMVLHKEAMDSSSLECVVVVVGLLGFCILLLSRWEPETINIKIMIASSSVWNCLLEELPFQSRNLTA